MIFTASETTPGLYQESNKDLYVAFKGKDGVWGNVKSLGLDVNTFDDERSPFLYPDNKTLYFSSEGHAGLGGMDIFFATRLDDTWVNWGIPKNLGKEVNSLGSDWGYTISTRPDVWEVYTAKADMTTDVNDLYTSEVPTFARPARIIPFSGRVIHPITKVGVQTDVVITNPDTGEPIDTTKTRPDGTFTFPIPVGLKTVSYHVLDKNLFPNSKTVSTDQIVTNPGFTDVIKTSSVEDMITNGIPASLNNITFDYDKSELKPESYPELERLFSLFNNQTWQLEISGHTDNAGSPEYNLALSQRRADAVKSYLVKKGLPANRMSTRGYGAEKPVTTNETEDGKAQNRRVEVRISK